jgi:hypothetical protein
VYINNAGDQMVAIKVKRAGGVAASWLNIRNQPIAEHKRSVQHRVR